jgi:hypothetical protein
MDLDNDYYSSRCKEINGLSFFAGTFMTLVGGDIDRYTLLYFNIMELFTVLGWRCSPSVLSMQPCETIFRIQV